MPATLPHPFWQNIGTPLPRGRTQLALRARYDAMLPADELAKLTPARWRRAVATLAHARLVEADPSQPVAARIVAIRILLAAAGVGPCPARDWNGNKKAGMRRRMRERREQARSVVAFCC